MKKLPLLPTLIVGLAIVAMIGLGIWQLRRAEWKEALLARYDRNARLPPIAFPYVPDPQASQLFRRASGHCLEAASWSARAGHNRAGESGWRHIALCRTGGAEGPGMAVDLGWSQSADPPKGYAGGQVSGVIGSDRDRIYLLVADQAAPGLMPSAPPSRDDIPNNHRGYAIQWFLFAAIAAIIYVLALNRRSRSGNGKR